MHKSYKFRVYPNGQQRQLLAFNLQCCQRLYNAALEQRRDAWSSRRRSLSCYSQQQQLPALRELPEYQAINAQILQNVLRRLDKAFKAFFRKTNRAGFPRFKAHDRYDSFTYPQTGNGSVRFNGKKICLSKIGAIRIKKHREIEGRIKTATVKREGKHWYIIFSCDGVLAKPLPPSDKEVGIDLGLTHFATFSDGSTVKNPRHLKKSLIKLKAAQQKLAKKKRGSSARRKSKEQVAVIHRKVRNQRAGFLHKLSRKIVNEFGFIAVEDLNVQGLLQLKEKVKKFSTGLHRSIGDVGWAMFISFLSYKAEEAERGIVKVPARGTTRTCFRCGFLADKLPLSQREFVCPDCGFRLDRDFNASLNILRLGRSLAGSARRSS